MKTKIVQPMSAAIIAEYPGFEKVSKPCLECT